MAAETGDSAGVVMPEGSKRDLAWVMILDVGRSVTWACFRLVGQMAFLLLCTKASHDTEGGASDEFVTIICFIFVVLATLCLQKVRQRPQAQIESEAITASNLCVNRPDYCSGMPPAHRD